MNREHNHSVDVKLRYLWGLVFIIHGIYGTFKDFKEGKQKLGFPQWRNS